MKISFQHANPDSGNESFLLRFAGAVDGPAPCVLVDAGDGTDVDALLGPDDRLAAICLTHAHLDHYAELSRAHRRGVPVLTSPPTAAALDDVFDVAGDEYGVETSERVSDAVTPIEDWWSVVPDVELRPVPAGHAPGAVGFLFRLTDDGETHRLLVTGDFTRRDAGGYPGLVPESIPSVDALFLTAATDDDFEAGLTAGLGRALEAAHGGGRTLLATSGLFGVQCAPLLAALSAQYDLGVSVRAVGQVAKLYDAMGYDGDVETVPEFATPERCLDPGVVTVAGPEIPRERSSGRLFDALADDPGACVVQLVGSGHEPVAGAGCTVHSFECSNHPTRETLTAVHDAVDPVQTVMTHSHAGAGERFNGLDSVVWGSGDTDEYTLYDGHSWRLPPWMGGGGAVASAPGVRFGDVAGTAALDSLSLPGIERREPPDPEAEGVDTDRIEELLHRDAGAATGPEVPDAVRPVRADGAEPNGEESAPAEATPTPDGPVATVSGDLGDRIDPEAEAMLEDRGISKAEFAEMLEEKRRQEAAEARAESAAAKSNAGETDPDTGATSERETESGAEQEPEANAEAEPEPDAEAEPEPKTEPGPAAEAEPAAEAAGEAAPGSEPPTAGTADGAEGGFTVEPSPLAAVLAEQAAEDRSVDDHIVDAVEAYVLALLAGDADGSSADQLAVDVDVGPAAESLLTGAASAAGFDSLSGLAADGIAAVLGGTGRSVRLPAELRPQLDAAVRNEAYAFTDRGAFLDAAIAHDLSGE